MSDPAPILVRLAPCLGVLSRKSAYLALSVAISLPAIAMTPTANAAAGGAPCFGCGFKGNEAYVGLSKEATKALPKNGKAKVTKGKKHVVKVVPYEYEYVHACPGNAPGKPDPGCLRTFTACLDVEDAEGPLVAIYRRPQVPEEDRVPWASVGETCWPKLIPNAKAKPELTVAMIRSEFVRTPFVKPRARMEPVGNRTLVNLPNYFTADFSGAGYGPGDVRTVTLLGHRVRIKPVLTSNTFHFGDGSSLGPTQSRGGGYPDGDVKHTYTTRGSVSVSVTTVYGGQFAVDGGAFTDLPGSATITGPAQPIQVLEATGRLVR